MSRSDDSEYLRLRAMASGELLSVAPRDAWVARSYYLYANEETIPLLEDQAAALAYLGLIFYSPWDGPNGRFYRLCDSVTVDQVKGAIS